MALRRRRRPTPGFGIPPPYSAIHGEHADLTAYGVFPWCALMQVAASDTHRDYVICRGFDVRTRKFIDYEAGNENKPGIPVAKPYGKRFKRAYQVGQIFPAFLPTQGPPDYVPPTPTDVDWRVGQNPGVAASTPGHPADLSEAVEELMTDDGTKYVNWMLSDGGGFGGSELVWCMTMEDHPGRGTCFDVILPTYCPKEAKFRFDCSADHELAIDWGYTISAGGTLPEPEMYAQGWFKPMPLENNPDHDVIFHVVTLDCESDGSCASHALPCADTETNPCA